MRQYRIDESKGMEFGIYSIGEHVANPHTGKRISAQQRIQELITTSQLAEQAGIDLFAIGESHQSHFTTQAHTVILGAVAQATEHIKISSSVTVLSVADPVRVYEDFATLDLISNGRAEIIAGRGSRLGAFHLLGYDINDYEALFEEKLALLTQLNREERVTWKGHFRPELRDAVIHPQPLDGSIPIWRGVGGPPDSAILAGRAGIPMTLTTLGGPAENFKIAVDAYRNAATISGHDVSQLPIATTSLFYTAKNSQDAVKEYYPHIDKGMLALRGTNYPQAQFEAATDAKDALMIGSPAQIIEKLHYQYELYGQQRFLAQIDFGGVPMDKIQQNIELIATEIMPAVKKFTAK